MASTCAHVCGFLSLWITITTHTNICSNLACNTPKSPISRFSDSVIPQCQTAGMGGAFCFALIFGGDLKAGLAAAAAGVAANAYLLFCGRRGVGGGFRTISTAALITLCCILAAACWALSPATPSSAP